MNNLNLDTAFMSPFPPTAPSNDSSSCSSTSSSNYISPISSTDQTSSCEEDGSTDLHGPPWSNKNIKFHPKLPAQVHFRGQLYTIKSRHCALTKKKASGYYRFPKITIKILLPY